MLKAGTLLYTVFISFLVSMICSFIILSAFYNNHYIDTSIARDKLVSNVESAINLALSDPSSIAATGRKTLDLYNDNEALVDIEKKYWGAYSILSASSSWRNYSFTKTALLGNAIEKEEQIALYLEDHQNFLSLCGNTMLTGTCYLPKLGPKSTYVEGRGFHGDQLVDGNIKISSNHLPQLNNSFQKSCNECLNTSYFGNDSVRYYPEYRQKDSIYNSFRNKTLVLLVDYPANLRFKHICGNIIIKSDYPVSVDPTLHLTDIILCAPEVTIKSGFKGCLQIIASKSITIEENCKLIYPSTVCLVNNKGTDNGSFIHIETKSEICGSVLLESSIKDELSRPILRIDKHAVVYGIVYCNQSENRY